MECIHGGLHRYQEWVFFIHQVVELKVRFGATHHSIGHGNSSTQLSNIKFKVEFEQRPCSEIDPFKDVGKFLYRNVHALHHKSYNPTAFSGTNMHPVESTLYYTAALIPCLWGGHPILGLLKSFTVSNTRKDLWF